MQSRRLFLAQAIGFSAAAAAAGFAMSSVAGPTEALAADQTPSSQENLMTAYSGESQAYQKYMAFALQAEADGLPQVAKLFRAVAAAETVHARTHLRNAGKVGNTMENLKTAIAGETYEFSKMYPDMEKEAAKEGKKNLQTYFSWAGDVEKGHSVLYQKALTAEGKIADVDYYVCNVCGHTQEGPNTSGCPVCHAGSSEFFKVS